MGEDWFGWVYVLTNEGMPGVVKIGHSRVCVFGRCEDLNRTGYYAEPFSVAWSGEFLKCHQVELGAHRILEECRLRHDRELFVTSVEAAIEAILRSDTEIRHHGEVQLPRLDGAPLPSLKSRRLRIPALYAWLKENHDAIDARISATGTFNEMLVTPIFEDLVSEWLSSLPADYRGRRCQPLGLFMEWGRVHEEVMFDRERNRLHLLEGTMMNDDQKRAALAAVQEVVEQNGANRGALVQWMLDNHDEFSQILSNKRPNWARLAEVFTKLGLSDDGKTLSAATVRHYWWRVRQMKLGVKPKRKRPAQRKAEAAVLPVVRVHERPAEARPVAVAGPVVPAVAVPPGDGSVPDTDVDSNAALALMIAEMDSRSGR